MDALQIREKEIFETLRALKGHSFVVIGGYAVNAYTLPRFSVDCDVAVQDKSKARAVGSFLAERGYSRKEIPKTPSPYANFERFEKELENHFNVSMDILIGGVLDRQTGMVFAFDWIFDHSKMRLLKGKTIMEELTIRIIDLDALFVMKFISARSTDIRDIFMLAPNLKDKKWVQNEISIRCDLRNRFERVKEKVSSKSFKDGLQGVYGHIDEKVFEKHQQAVLEMA
ncbi:MAG: hypothetical protein HY393_01295 [Candidatus Diapherotrites archaeon]|nr:hypothetical protein [Candidatus Diapherotrites archaeon]